MCTDAPTSPREIRTKRPQEMPVVSIYTLFRTTLPWSRGITTLLLPRPRVPALPPPLRPEMCSRHFYTYACKDVFAIPREGLQLRGQTDLPQGAGLAVSLSLRLLVAPVVPSTLVVYQWEDQPPRPDGTAVPPVFTLCKKVDLRKLQHPKVPVTSSPSSTPATDSVCGSACGSAPGSAPGSTPPSPPPARHASRVSVKGPAFTTTHGHPAFLETPECHGGRPLLVVPDWAAHEVVLLDLSGITTRVHGYVGPQGVHHHPLMTATLGSLVAVACWSPMPASASGSACDVSRAYGMRPTSSGDEHVMLFRGDATAKSWTLLWKRSTTNTCVPECLALGMHHDTYTWNSARAVLARKEAEAAAKAEAAAATGAVAGAGAGSGVGAAAAPVAVYGTTLTPDVKAAALEPRSLPFPVVLLSNVFLDAATGVTAMFVHGPMAYVTAAAFDSRGRVRMALRSKQKVSTIFTAGEERTSDVFRRPVGVAVIPGQVVLVRQDGVGPADWDNTDKDDHDTVRETPNVVFRPDPYV